MKNLRENLQESDFEKIAEIMGNTRKTGASFSADEIRDGMENGDREIKALVKYYCCLNELKAQAIEKLIANYSDLRSSLHFFQTVKGSLSDINEHILNLDRDDW